MNNNNEANFPRRDVSLVFLLDLRKNLLNV